MFSPSVSQNHRLFHNSKNNLEKQLFLFINNEKFILEIFRLCKETKVCVKCKFTGKFNLKLAKCFSKEHFV